MLKRSGLVFVRVTVVLVVAIAATAGGTWAASHGVPATGLANAPAVTPRKATPLMVPDVRHLPFVFAKEALEDAGFAWRVKGKVHGYPANTVVSQTPSPGAKMIDNGAPLVVLSLERTKGYPQVGQPQDVSPYAASKARPAGLARG